MRKAIYTKGDLEGVLRAWLPYFFLAVFVATFLGTFQGYVHHNAFRMGDWLINYQGGMVRRGITGELAYQLSLITRVNPGVFVIVLQTFFYGLFLLFSYLLLKRQHTLYYMAILIFSPFIFTFQLNDMQGGYRKEIIYFALLAINVWAAVCGEQRRFARIFHVTLLLYPFVILAHEILALFLPYLLCIYFSRVTPDRESLIRVGVLLVPSAAAFLVAVHYSGSAQHAVAIANSISELGYEVKGGSIGYIGRSVSSVVEKVSSEASIVTILALIPTVLLSSVAFKPVYSTLRQISKSRFNLVMLLASVAATLLLFLVAVDWGRFIYIHLVSLFFLLLTLRAEPLSPAEMGERLNIQRWMLVAMTLYFTIWHIGHALETFSLFGVVNPINTLFLILFFIRYRLVIVKPETEPTH